MKYTEARLGRVFVLRLEDGDRLPDVIEEFAARQVIEAAAVLFIGGAERGSKVVVGPADGAAEKPVPMVTDLPGVSEAAGVGTIFLNEDGVPKLHLHAAFGRKDNTITGCTREGVAVWHIGEAMIMELANASARRKVNPATGFELLEVE
jgi:predicted DNA-binding protein with PD1-like motif